MTDLDRGLAEIADLERIGDEIATLAAHIHAATYRLLVLLADFDERGGWTGGFRTCAHWLSWRTGIALGAAREKARAARALRSLPLISDAMRAGELSFAKVRAITRVATPGNEERLLEIARQGTASHIEMIVRAWKRVDGYEEREVEAARHESRHLWLYQDSDGMYVINGRLTAEVGALLQKALDNASRELFEHRDEGGSSEDEPARETDSAQRRADAVGLVAERAVGATKGRPAFEVVLHVDADGQAVIDGGSRVSAETSRRIACNAAHRVMVHDTSGNPLDVGRRTRAVPTAIRRALDHRDRSCRFPGCGLRFCDAHHIEHWEHGGTTRLDNLVLLCRFHHRTVHEGGYRIERDDVTGTLTFRHPKGFVVEHVPASPPLERDLVALHDAEGVSVDGESLASYASGARLDVGLALVLLRGTERAVS